VSSDADLLATIVAATRRTVEARARREPLGTLARRAEAVAAVGGRFQAALARPGRVNVIAECKRRSPSRGVLMAEYQPAAIARQYERGGAAAISCLTEPTFFDGSLDHLREVSGAVALPVLRKDFLISEYQIFEARANGAAAVLLIVAALQPAELIFLLGRATELGLDVLVEVHGEAELAPALDAGASIVGVNNRNLRTLAVDVEASERLIARIPRDVIAVSESGLKSASDLQRLRGLGYRAFLIGERLMLDADPAAALERLIGEGAAC
jgi:indole-3-glycerol phosphate synthase